MNIYRHCIHHHLPPAHPQPCMCVCSVDQSCLTLCNPMGRSLSAPSVHRNSQARILEWVVISFSRGSLQARDRTCISCIGRWILYHCATWEAPSLQFSSVQFSCSVVSDPLRPHESQHTRPPCPSPTPGVYSNSSR